MPNILIVDDDETIRKIFQNLISRSGHAVFAAKNMEEGLRLIETEPIDIVFLDVLLPDGNGLEALSIIKQKPFSPEVIIITGSISEDGVELAIKNGAWNFIQKPLIITEILTQLEQTLEYRYKKLACMESHQLDTEGIIGKSEEIKQTFRLVAQCAKSDANVHISGRTGTGKELFAKIIHRNSHRAKGPFVVVDCTVLPEQLVESTLFGYEKGAFTGANETREGLIKCADNGTLFLDEIGELNLSVQKSLLRVLQERQFRAVGSNKVIHSNFRLISATNRSLDRMVAKKEFREDLLFRLRTVTVELPTLTERKADIKELVIHYVQELCEKNNLTSKSFTSNFILLLETYDWPGNIRELISALEKAILSEPNNPILYPVHLPENIRINFIKSAAFKEKIEQAEKTDHASQTQVIATSRLDDSLATLKEFRNQCYAELEREYLKQLMFSAEQNMQKACSISGLKQARLYDLMRKHGINRDTVQ